MQKDPWFSSLPEIIVTPVAGGFLVLLPEFPSLFNVTTPASLLHRGMKGVGTEHHRGFPLSSLDRKLSSGGTRLEIHSNRLPTDVQPVEAGNQCNLSLLGGGSFHGTDRFPIRGDPDRSLPLLPNGVQGDHRLGGKGQIRRVEDDRNRCCLRARESPGKERDQQRQAQECHVKRTPSGSNSFRNALRYNGSASAIRPLKIEVDRIRPAQGLGTGHPAAPRYRFYRKCIGFSVIERCLHGICSPFGFR